MPDDLKIGFGGGCHWCMEAVYQSLLGVSKVKQGWISSKQAPDYSEAVVVYFNPAVISLDTLVEIHLHTHSCTSAHKLRTKYRSAVYAFSSDQKKEAAHLLDKFQKDFDAPLQTQAYDFASFRLNRESYLDYYYRNPEKPFCKNIIDPKLRFLLARFRPAVDGDKLGQ